MGSGISKKQSEKPASAAPKKKGKSFQLKCLTEHTDCINAMCMSPDGNTIITVSEDKTGRLWDTKTEESIGELRGHEKYITSICVWERYVFTGSADMTIRKWNFENGVCIRTMRGHSKAVNQVMCSGNFIFSSSYDRTIRCWSADTGDYLKKFEGHKNAVISLLIVSESSHRGGAFAAVDIENNDDIVISGSADCTAKSWGVNSNDSTVTYKGHSGAVMCLAVDGKGKTLFTGSADHTIRSWDLLTGAPIRAFDDRNSHQGSIVQIQVVNKLLYSCSTDHTAKCWVVEFGDCTRTYKGHKLPITQMQYQDGILFTASGDKHAKAFDAKSGTHKRTFTGHTSAIHCLLASSGKLYTGDNEGSLRIWDATKLRDDEDDIYNNQKVNGVKK